MTRPDFLEGMPDMLVTRGVLNRLPLDLDRANIIAIDVRYHRVFFIVT